MRPLLLALLLAACAPADSSATDEDAADDAGEEADTAAAAGGASLDDRAAAAGLSAAQVRALVGLDVPVVVPVLPEGWALHALDASAEEYEGMRWPSYTLRYRHEGGACFALDAASEGIGDVFLTEPPHVREVDVPGIATYGAVPLGYAEEGEAAEGWETAGVQTEWFGADGVFFSLGSTGGDACTPLPPDDAAALLAALRYLDPADDALALGPLAPLETMEAEFDPAEFARPDPEAAVEALFEGGPGADEVTVETLPAARHPRRRRPHAPRAGRRGHPRRAAPRGRDAPGRRRVDARPGGPPAALPRGTRPRRVERVAV